MPKKISGSKDFIYWDYIKDLSICDQIIEYHTNSKEKTNGLTSGGYDPKKKDSLDCWLKEGYEFSLYTKELQFILSKYIKKFPYCNEYDPWGLKERPNIQHYKPGGGFKVWHCERASNKEPISSRHLVYMTYLNDVKDGGETEWYHQKLKVKPKKGLTVIWPADWTYTHRGIPSKTEDKYIVTGWLNFMETNNS